MQSKCSVFANAKCIDIKLTFTSLLEATALQKYIFEPSVKLLGQSSLVFRWQSFLVNSNFFMVIYFFALLVLNLCFLIR